MAETDNSANPGKAQDAGSNQTVSKSTGESAPSAARAEAQAGDPYRPTDGNDYALAVDPEDTGEATLSNLYLAVPLEDEGTGSALQNDGGSPGGGGIGGDAGAGVLGNGLGLDRNGDVPLPDGETNVVETADGLVNDDGGLGDGDVPEARGLDATLPQFDLGGNGIAAGNSGVGDSIGGGGGGGDEGSPIGPLLDADGDDNFVTENAAEGTVVGVVARAVDPDGDAVTYEIVGDSPFVIDPITGVIKVGPDAEIDREATDSIEVTVLATSSDGSSVVKTFTVQIGDDTSEFTIGPVTDIDADDNFVQENAAGGTVVEVTAFAEDPDETDTVTYEIVDTNSPFEIDTTTGLITVKNGAVIDREETPFIDVTVKATSTDGSTSSQTFRIRVGDENESPIGPVDDSDTSTNFVMENADAGTVVGVTAFATDPDATDTVTYEILDTDSPFVIDPNTGVITVGPNADIDRETVDSIDVTVRATSSDGSTSTKTFTVEVGDENETGVGPVIDRDDRDNDLNAVAENGAGGEEVGITAFAEDLDATDEVTYSTEDLRFDIDPDTGVLTVKDGVSFDYEKTKTVDVEITATSTDGSSSTGIFTVNILDVNEAPDLDFDPELGAGVSVTMTFVEEGAGYSNTMGVFYMDADGNPVGGEIVWVDQNVLTAGDSKTIHFEGVDAADVGYFLIPDGADMNSGLASGDQLTFQKDADGNWQAVAEDGTPLVGKGGNILFSGDGALNPDGFDQTEQTGFVLSFEDIKGGGDKDFNDVVVTQGTFETDAQAAVYEEEFGAVVGDLTVSDPDEIDTQTFEVSDERFEVVASGDKFVLKLKDDQKLDYETETQVTVDVTVYDKGDLTDTETIVINVIDVIENTAPIGPLSDSDATGNAVNENAGGGTAVGVTAFASDPDAGDSVVYKIVNQDSPFEIDADTGVITVKDGAVIDREATPTLDVKVQAISTDGSSVTKTFTIDVTDGNEPPDLIVHLDNASHELVVNGGFETFTGTLKGADGTGWYDIPDTLEGWTYTDVDVHQSARHGEGTTDGGHRLDLTADDNGTISQVIEGQLDGQVYTLSFNMNSLGNKSGEGVAEVYWNGELIDTIDPTDGGSGWQSYSYDIVGGAGDGSNTLKFVETGSDNSHGTYIDSVSIKSDGRIAILEEFAGAEVAPLSVIDPDVGDSHTFTVSDDRFEVIEANGKYLLKLKDDKALDYETETQVTVEITATDSGGLSDTETVVVDVIDIDENTVPVGPVSDVDQTGNRISELADGGESVGITAFAEDTDAADTVSYELTDDGNGRFEIDANSGVVTVKDGAAFDAETEADVSVTVKAISTDGSTASKTFTIDVIDGNEPPDLVVEYGDVGNNLIKNGSFESFDVASGAWKQFGDDSSGAWTSNGKMEIWDAYGGVSATEGDQHLELDSERNVNSISQTVETSMGQVYDLSFDARARTNNASNTVEVYWNGELVSEVDPQFGAWETLEFQVVGTGGNDVLEFRETSEDNNTYGAFIDNVQLTGTDRIGVVEEKQGAEIVPLSVIDPDAGDTHTFTLSDDRFEVVEANGEYLLKLKDDQKLDYESETQVTVQITATDSGGLSDTETVVIDVLDIDEGAAPDLVVHLDNGGNQFIVNGSFEVFDGPLGGRDGSGWYQDPNSIDGWTYDNVDVHQAGHGNFGATDGGHHLDLASVTNGRASQQIEGQLDGQVYELQFDMKSRGGAGQSVAEVYWNGELIDTIDPATTGSGWQTYNYNIVGGSGDGSNTLTFVEIGSDNNGGALIDSVSIVSDSRTAVVEEHPGAEIAPMSVIDPDVGDTHTFTVSDDRFEVVVSGDKYMLKLKDYKALDYESETQVTVQVTATDQSGLADTETVVIEVIDIDDANAPVGALVDTDNTHNSVDENGAGGEYVGVTVEAVDPDGEAVTYTTDDPRFDIDPVTGELTVKDGVSFDFETTQSVDVEITATSADGSTSTGTFTVAVNDVNEAPGMDFDPELGPGVSVTLTFVEEAAGFSNMLGVFYTDGNGNPVGGEIVWADVNPLAPGATETVYLEGAETASVGYFLIPDGGSLNSGLANGEPVTFQKDGNGNWQAVTSNGTLIVGAEANIYFSGDGSLNADGFDHAQELGATISFEDRIDGGDQDFNDLVVQQSTFEAAAEAAIYEEEAGAVVGQLSVADPDAGDTATFTVSDERFEVVETGGNYVLKLKDDMAVDYETEQTINIDITVTDSGGLSDTQNITIAVIDDVDGATQQVGTAQNDVLVGGGTNDTLRGEGGDDILIGQGGADTLFGGSGEDVMRGGTGNDTMNGGEGGDLFAYMLGDGNDTISGGAGGNWIDIIDLANAADGTQIGAYGTDWSITMTEGTIENVDAANGEITLSQDVGGYIELADGGRVDFAEIEGIQY